jgi:hypothetical protein
MYWFGLLVCTTDGTVSMNAEEQEYCGIKEGGVGIIKYRT